MLDQFINRDFIADALHLSLETKAEALSDDEYYTASVTSVNNQTGSVILTANLLGLGNVENTQDDEKPVSTATSDAISVLKTAKTADLAGYLDLANIGEAAGSVPLDTDKLVDKSYFPDEITSAMTYKGAFDPTTDTLPSASNGDLYMISAEGTVEDTEVDSGDIIIYNATTESFDVFNDSDVEVENATTSAVGLVQIAGDLSGTATAPTIYSLGDGALTYDPDTKLLAPASDDTMAISGFYQLNIVNLRIYQDRIRIGDSSSLFRYEDDGDTIYSSGVTTSSLYTDTTVNLTARTTNTQVYNAVMPAIYPDTGLTAAEEAWTRLEALEDFSWPARGEWGWNSDVEASSGTTTTTSYANLDAKIGSAIRIRVQAGNSGAIRSMLTIGSAIWTGNLANFDGSLKVTSVYLARISGAVAYGTNTVTLSNSGTASAFQVAEDMYTAGDKIDCTILIQSTDEDAPLIWHEIRLIVNLGVTGTYDCYHALWYSRSLGDLTIGSS